jgi:hypothetical protein
MLSKRSIYWDSITEWDIAHGSFAEKARAPGAPISTIACYREQKASISTAHYSREAGGEAGHPSGVVRGGPGPGRVGSAPAARGVTVTHSPTPSAAPEPPAMSYTKGLESLALGVITL